MANILSGKELSEKLLLQQAQEVAQLKQKGIVPGLVVILVGEDPASQIYVRNKMRACEKVGIYSKTIRLEKDTSQDKLIEIIDRLNIDEKINGILVQLPLPKHIDEQKVLMRILPEKDVDGFPYS